MKILSIFLSSFVESCFNLYLIIFILERFKIHKYNEWVHEFKSSLMETQNLLCFSHA